MHTLIRLNPMLWIVLMLVLVAVLPVFAEEHDAAVGLSEAEILAYSGPDIQPLEVDAALLGDRQYQWVNGAVEVFDVPNGNVLSTLDAGYNLVTVMAAQDGWTQVNDGQWMRSEALSLATPSSFAGILLPDELPPYPVAWVLVNLYPSLAPGESPNMDYPIVWRYSRVNLIASVEVDGWLWYQIGPDQWVHQTHVAQVAPVTRPPEVDTHHWVGIDIYEQTAIAYEGNRPIFATLVATGLAQWPTNEGVHHIYYRRTRANMSGGTPGDDFYYIEEVPWTMYFDEGRALHGAFWHDEFGYRHSHGCINLSVTDAHWLYQWVAEAMGTMYSVDREHGPAVYIYSSGEYR